MITIMIRSRIAFAHSILIVLCFLVVGCHKAKPKTTSLPYAGKTIRVAVPARHQFAEAWDLTISEWQAQNNATVELIEVGGDGTPLTTDDYAAVDPHLLFFPLEQSAEFAEARLIKKIPEELLKRSWLDWNDYFSGLREQAGTLEGDPAMAVLSCPVLVCLYRADLLQQADLEPPATWEEYQELARTISQWAPGKIVAEPWSPDFRTTMWHARAAGYGRAEGNFSLFFDVARGTPLIDQPPFEIALKHARELVQIQGGAILDMSPADCLTAIQNGQAALAITYLDLEMTAEREKVFPTGVAPLPGTNRYFSTTQGWTEIDPPQVNRITFGGFTGFAAAVSPLSNDVEQEACWSLFRELAIPIPTDGFNHQTRSLCRAEQVNIAEEWLPATFTPNEKALAIETQIKQLSERVFVRDLPVVERERLMDAEREQLRKIFADEVSVKEGLAAIKSAWQDIADEIGVEKLRASYRRQIGLVVFAPEP